MSEFENEVAEALRSSGSEIGMAGVQGICERHDIDFLVACKMIRVVLDARAPRVAAAFLGTVDGNDVQAQSRFVAALKAVAP